jgi:hypothetical protein
MKFSFHIIFFCFCCLEERAFKHIFQIFDKKTIRYVCVANETDMNENMPRLNIQIILYEKKSIYTPFMDKFLGWFLILKLIYCKEIYIQ